MVYELSKTDSLANSYLAEIRDVTIQKDRLRFRRNMECLGSVFAYELSKKMTYQDIEVTTPLGTSLCKKLQSQPVLATILRAGLPLHQGMLHFFDKADSAFVSAYRKHHKSGKFTIKLEYLSCPDLDDRILIISDPMLATGASMLVTLEQLLEQGDPAEVHVVTVIACSEGIEVIRRNYPNVEIWTAVIDDELTAKGYIVPGLGDAGDLSYGDKLQD